MSLIKYEATPIHKPAKEGIRVISEMSTAKIVSYVAYRHRVGLLALSTVFMFSYIAYDKLIKILL
jgi:hypothetical protein